MAIKGSVVSRIRALFQTEGSNDWIYEKGKTKEATLLKEACELIETQRKELDELRGQKWKLEELKYEQVEAIKQPFKERIYEFATHKEAAEAFVKSVKSVLTVNGF